MVVDKTNDCKINIDNTRNNFKHQICMYINDCMQVLKKNKWNKEAQEQEFAPTDNEELIIYAFKELKDLCIEHVGGNPLNWKD